MQGVPLMKLSVTVLVLCVAFIAAGTALAITGHSQLANGAFGNVSGIILGGGGVTLTIIKNNGKNGGPTPPGTITQ